MRHLWVLPFFMMETSPIVTGPYPGPHPPLAATSSVSITREAGTVVSRHGFAMAAPVPTRTPYTWLEAHCGPDEEHPNVQYPPCGP